MELAEAVFALQSQVKHLETQNKALESQVASQAKQLQTLQSAATAKPVATQPPNLTGLKTELRAEIKAQIKSELDEQWANLPPALPQPTGWQLKPMHLALGLVVGGLLLLIGNWLLAGSPPPAPAAVSPTPVASSPLVSPKLGHQLRPKAKRSKAPVHRSSRSKQDKAIQDINANADRYIKELESEGYH